MEAKRMSATEKEWLTRLGIVKKIIEEDEPLIRRRVAMVQHGPLMINGARGLLRRFLRDVENTLNENDRRVLWRSLADSSYTIGIRCRATKNNERRNNDEYGIVVPINAINALLQASKDHCLVCVGGVAEAKECALRRALDMIPNDEQDRDDGACPYREAM